MRLPPAILSTALLGLSMLHPPLRAEELGRLFFTPEQRALLDLARRTQATAAQTEAPSDGVTLSGIVTRSDGRQTVWINGRPQPAGVATGRSPASASIPLPGGGGQVRLRVGQTLDPTSGKVEEGYRRSRPVPAESKPAPTHPATTQAKPPTPAAPGANDDGNGADESEPGTGAAGH